MQENDIYYIEKWYNKHTKLWVIQCKDNERNQVGEALYLPKKEAEIEYNRLVESHRIKV